jgi:hypothetical protein
VCWLDTARPTRAKWSSCCFADRLWRAPSAAALSTRSAATRVRRSTASDMTFRRGADSKRESVAARGRQVCASQIEWLSEGGLERMTERLREVTRRVDLAAMIASWLGVWGTGRPRTER